MSLYIVRQSFRGDNVLTVVSDILKIVRNYFKLLRLERVTNFWKNIGINKWELSTING